MRRVAILVVFVFLAAGCGTGKDRKAHTTPSAEKKTQGKKAKRLRAKGKKYSGWRWKGNVNNCFFVVKNRCYAKKKRACSAAHCGRKRCEAEGAAPAEVFCKGSKKRRHRAEKPDKKKPKKRKKKPKKKSKKG